MTVERRFVLRDDTYALVNNAPADGEPVAKRFNGRALTYNSRTAIGDPKTWGFYEEIAPGAATRTLAEAAQAFLVNHDTYRVVSRTEAGTLSLREEANGVYVDSAMDQELSYVRDLTTNLTNGNVRGMSFGFTIPKGGDTWSTVELESRDDKGEVTTVEAELRTITDLDLMEVSAVTFPAYTDTEAFMRDVPALAERRDAWSERTSVTSKPEADTKKTAEQMARRMRYLAARYGLPTGRN